MERQAGTTPRVLNRPRLGLRPTMLLKAAGTRPEPAVSVPSEKLARPVATATADQALDPGRRSRRGIGEGRTGRRGWDARQIYIVLDDEGDAVKRQFVHRAG